MAILIVPSAQPRWSVDHSCIQTSRAKGAQFISYLMESGFRQMNVDGYEASLRRRRVQRRFVLTVGGRRRVGGGRERPGAVHVLSRFPGGGNHAVRNAGRHAAWWSA